MPRLSEPEKIQFGIEQRIRAFEQYEAPASQESGAKQCCKTRGNAKCLPERRRGNTVTYKCRGCGCEHVRIFADFREAAPRF